jgi:hypothetical protein
MKIAFIEIYPAKVMNKSKMIDAHLRNAIILNDYFGGDLLCVENDFKNALNKKYDVLILCFATHYAPFEYIKKIISNNINAVKIVISNDVNFVSSIGGFRPYHLIAGYEAKLKKSELSVNTLNINLLLSDKANELKTKKYDCIYYGTFRKDRKKYFTKYLQKDVYLSTSVKNMKQFKHIGCNPKYINKLQWTKNKETLNNFKYQIYIEDVVTHNTFCNLANRWYEAGICNNVVFFDVNCINTILKSEIGQYYEQIKYYIVNDSYELQHKIKECNQDFEKHLEIQKKWRNEEPILKNKMLNEIKNIINNLVTK